MNREDDMIRFNKKTDDNEEDFLFNMATKVASVNISYLISDAQKVIYAFIHSLYEKDMERLPYEMTENFYKSIVRSIENDKIERGLTELIIHELRPVDYDNRIMYTVKTITYEAKYTVIGYIIKQKKIYFEMKRIGHFVFLNESRMGWILKNHLNDKLDDLTFNDEGTY